MKTKKLKTSRNSRTKFLTVPEIQNLTGISEISSLHFSKKAIMKNENN